MYNHIITWIRPTTETPFDFQSLSEQYTVIKDIRETSPGFIGINFGYTDDKLSYKEVRSWEDSKTAMDFVATNKKILDEYQILSKEYNTTNKISVIVTSETINNS
jgi:hypothetical protein